jgi:hypothetical protein
VRTGTVVVISTIAHAVLVAMVADWATPPAKRRVTWRPAKDQMATATAHDAVPAAAEPIEIAFIVDAPTPTTPTAIEAPPRTSHRGGGSWIATSRGAAEPGAASTSATPEVTEARGGDSAKSGLMKMRGADLTLDAGTAERIANAPQAPRDELRKSGKLQSTPGGGAAIYDRVTTLSVEKDGTAHFDDKPDIDTHFHLPIPRLWEVDRMRRDLGQLITEWYKDPEAGKRFGRMQDLPRHLQASPGACDGWGNTMCDDPLAPKAEQLVRERKKVLGRVYGGPADITAYLHRKFVGDPYASRKLKLLTDTFDERAAMREAHRAEQAARSAELMRNNLERLWAREANAIARRAALFELWDECGEDEAGQRARTVVIGWIRAKLPAGSADAFTADEVATLQARRTSTAAFVPYD